MDREDCDPYVKPSSKLHPSRDSTLLAPRRPKSSVPNLREPLLARLVAVRAISFQPCSDSCKGTHPLPRACPWLPQIRSMRPVTAVYPEDLLNSISPSGLRRQKLGLIGVTAPLHKHERRCMSPILESLQRLRIAAVVLMMNGPKPPHRQTLA